MVWARVKRVRRSRKSVFLGRTWLCRGRKQTPAMHYAPRSEPLVAARLSAPVVRILSDGKCVTGVQIPDGDIRADAAISTIPTPLVSATVPYLPRDWKTKY